MYRLNNRAFNILRAEVFKCTGDDAAGKVQRDIVLKRLEKLRDQSGSPASLEELRATVIDMLPNFSQEALKSAAQSNRPAGMWGLIPAVGVLLAGAAGLVWFANLPFPMIRKPVAKVAPILLFPSYRSMDYSYRQAIALVEQADQLVNKATGPADIDLGEQKVKAAQKHLDSLPVWFLGYQPGLYCSFFSCSWKFTLDEFETARKSIGRMEATVFQEQNAQKQLSEAETALASAQQQYQQAKPGTEQQQAIGAWQAAIDQMQQLPESTLAERMARKKLLAAQRDFKTVVGDTSGRARTNTLIEAAKKFAMVAAQSSQNPPHTAEEWGVIVEQWEQAIRELKYVPPQDAGYVDAVEKIAEYQKNQGIARARQKAEQEATEALKEAKETLADLQKMASSPRTTTGEITSKLQEIINKLETVKTGTTTYAEAQNLLKFARENQQKLQGN